jgi:hypothetical protein
MTPPEGIQSILSTAGLGYVYPGTDTGNTGWPIVVGPVIDKPDRLISIRRTGGKTPNPAHNIDYPSVQVRVRGKVGEYVAADGQARRIKDALLGKPSFDLGGDRWTGIWMIGDIVDLGQDENNRPAFAVNFSLIIEPSNAGNRDT